MRLLHPIVPALVLLGVLVWLSWGAWARALDALVTIFMLALFIGFFGVLVWGVRLMIRSRNRLY